MMIAAVILAAGQGTRMRSALPKVLHPLLGRPLAAYSIETSRQVSGSAPVMVVGHEAEAVRAAFGDQVRFAVQEPQLGTAHAVLQAEPLLRGEAGLVLVTYADMPLLTGETLRRLVEIQQVNSGPVTMLSAVAQEARGFGRVLRDEAGNVRGIVEEAQATPEQLAVREVNAGAYCFAADWLWEALRRIPLSPKGEYYLTDVAGLAVAEGLAVGCYTTPDLAETIGINNRVHLAEAEAALRARINRGWMLAGVTLVDPAVTYIEPGVSIGQDTIIWPNTYLRGNTSIGEACEVGPDSILIDTRTGSRCTILASVMEKAVLEDEVQTGPFCRLRKGAHLERGVHLGNFGEVKNSTLGPGVKMGHFSYIGDATIGENVNIGAGTITCNYDGKRKNHTEIGAGAFIGSDTMLVAPVKIGEGANTGAGSVVTKNIPPNSLAVGVPARVIRRLEKVD
jgi:bifunctional UDP-N-acetylglucosamine pyrophosphorylase/glucosamine-1-phosphate N-acetyltransferase